MLFQVFINSLVVGSIYALVAIGFVLTYTTTKFLNFSQGAIIGASAYAFLFSFSYLGWFGAFVFAIFTAVLLNFLFYIFIFKKMLNKKASKVILLLISFAILMAMESVIQIIFSASPQRIDLPIQKGIEIFGASITKIQILIILTTIIILVLTWLVIKKTKVGLGLRAVSENKELAEIYGLNAERIVLWSFLIAGFLGAVAGTMIALEYVITPGISTFYMIKGFVGAVTGGVASLYGAIFGSYIVGIFENYGAWFFASSYKDAIAFILLFLMLLIKPEGLFGIKKGIRG